MTASRGSAGVLARKATSKFRLESRPRIRHRRRLESRIAALTATSKPSPRGSHFQAISKPGRVEYCHGTEMRADTNEAPGSRSRLRQGMRRCSRVLPNLPRTSIGNAGVRRRGTLRWRGAWDLFCMRQGSGRRGPDHCCLWSERHISPGCFPISSSAKPRPQGVAIVNAIERAFENAAGPESDYCQVCRGPLSTRARAPILVLREGEEVGACSACGRPVDTQGRSVCRASDRGVTVVECVQFGSYP